jgi:hypothetical protein
MTAKTDSCKDGYNQQKQPQQRRNNCKKTTRVVSVSLTLREGDVYEERG